MESDVIEGQGLKDPVLIARVGASIDQHWISSDGYPQHQIEKTTFEDALGPGERLQVTYTGLAGRPDLICTLQLYKALSYGSIEAGVRNKTVTPVTVQAIRSLDAIGEPRVDLGGNPVADRILSDTFSDYDFKRRIPMDLTQPTGGMHRGVGSQLTYNRQSGESLFLGALATQRFLTVLGMKMGSSHLHPYESLLIRLIRPDDSLPRGSHIA